MIDPTCKHCGSGFTTEDLRDTHEGVCRYNPIHCKHLWHVHLTCSLCRKQVELEGALPLKS